jgi:hypothetical protein
MADRNDIDVFVSYHHGDRERVRPLVEAMKARGWEVFWDTAIGIGDEWREVITDRLDHARAVCVVWTTDSVSSRWVRDEASRGGDRGVLVPVRLDRVDQPLGFREFQYADLANASTASAALEPTLKKIAQLVDAGPPATRWQPELSQSPQVHWTESGVSSAEYFLGQVRAKLDMLAANPGAANGLRSALAGVRDTDSAVACAIDEFLAPIGEHAAVTVDTYRRLATGRLVTEIERQRGHCKRIAQTYIQAGGLRSTLPDTVDDDMRLELDMLIRQISVSDIDLFNAMAQIGKALQDEASAVANLLLTGQYKEANARLVRAENALLPLRQRVNASMAEVDRLTAELGI